MAMKEYEKCEDKITFVPMAYKEYMDVIHIYDQIRVEVVKLTIF